MDADKHQSLAQKYGVSGFPTIKIFTGSKHTPYQGQRNAEGFVEAALKAAKDKAYENLGKKSGSSDKVISNKEKLKPIDKQLMMEKLNYLLKEYGKEKGFF